jgi:hypothetical protein
MTKKKKNRWKQAGVFVFSLALGGVIGYGIGALAKGKVGDLGVSLPAGVVLLLSAFFLVILAHEVGHLVAGMLFGGEFKLLVVGPLRVDRDEAGVHWKWNREIGMVGGLAAVTPARRAQKDLGELRRAMLAFAAGGPAASVLGMAALVPAAWLLPEYAHMALLLGGFGLFSGLIALGTLIPMEAGGFQSDGARILDLLRGKPEADRWCALAALSGMSYVDRPRLWPGELVEQATRLQDESPDVVSAAWLRYSFHEDRKELAEARVWLGKALEAKDCWAGPLQEILHATAAHFEAWYEKNAEGAREHLVKVGKASYVPPETKLMAEGALALLEGRAEEARAAAEKGMALNAKRKSTTGDAIREGFEEILAVAGRT